MPLNRHDILPLIEWRGNLKPRFDTGRDALPFSPIPALKAPTRAVRDYP
jgi:hypothetical protein